MFGMELGQLLPYLGSLLGMLGLGGGAAQRWIQRDDRALVLRFGDVVTYRNTRKNRRLNRVGEPRVLEPGFNMIVPFIDHISKTHVREVVANLGDEQVTLKDKTVFTVDGVIVYHVNLTPRDIERAIFAVDDLRGAIRRYSIGVLREVVRDLTYDELISGSAEEIRTKLTERVQEQLAAWGLRVTSFGLGDLSPYGATLAMIQTVGAVGLKVTALEGAAVRIRALGLDPALAAALIGIPVTAAITSTSTASEE